MRLIDADAIIEKKWQAESEACFYALEDVVSVTDIEEALTIEVSEDCISKAYLEQEIENLCRTVDKDKEYWRGWNNALDKVVELIEDAPTSLLWAILMVVTDVRSAKWISHTKQTIALTAE